MVSLTCIQFILDVYYYYIYFDYLLLIMCNLDFKVFYSSNLCYPYWACDYCFAINSICIYDMGGGLEENKGITT